MNINHTDDNNNYNNKLKKLNHISPKTRLNKIIKMKTNYNFFPKKNSNNCSLNNNKSNSKPNINNNKSINKTNQSKNNIINKKNSSSYLKNKQFQDLKTIKINKNNFFKNISNEYPIKNKKIYLNKK